MSNLLSYEYNRAYLPPAPFIPVSVDGYDPAKPAITLSCFVDTGADGTLLPIDVLSAVGAEYEDTVLLRGSTGAAQRLDRYTVRIRVGDVTIQSVAAVAMAVGSEPIIGRDVLNYLVLTLDGVLGLTEIRVDK